MTEERPPTPAIRVAIVDDHPLVRSAIRQAVSAPDVVVVGEAACGEEALDLLPALRPDVALVDINLPGVTGLQLVRELSSRLPDTRFVMLTVSTSERDVLEALDYGAVGYLTKDLAPEALLRAVRGAHAGDLTMPRRMAGRIVKRLVERTRRNGRTALNDGFAALSARELEVLRMIADDLTDREVAAALVLSRRTVETHVSNVLRKLGARNRAEAARLYRASR
ncbi:MAG TPA: response regulator transcription factor [Candidatus Limnocylindrales bacterium]|nr:response regulator transcription factor [Candidatus Limnocylindrales bacterium]